MDTGPFLQQNRLHWCLLLKGKNLLYHMHSLMLCRAVIASNIIA